MSNQIRYVIHFQSYFEELTQMYGSTVLERSTCFLACYKYMHDVYGVESSEYKRRLSQLSFNDEIIVLDISKSDVLRRAFSANRFPDNVYHIDGMEAEGQFLVIYLS